MRTIKKDMDLVRSILEERYPEYVRAFDDVMERTAGHRFNMFIMRRDLLDHYCTWLFDVLDRAERQINLSEYDEYNKRVFGFLSERLLDVGRDESYFLYRNAGGVHGKPALAEKRAWRLLSASFGKTGRKK